MFVYDGTAAVPRHITQAKIESSVKEIPYGAFKDCRLLEQVDFSEAHNLKVIGEDAFYYCSALKGAKFPKNLEVISKEAFNGCSRLQDADFSEADSLMSIGYHAFFKCTALKKMEFPKNLSSVATRAFRYCGFTLVDMSKAVHLERIEDSTFSRCTDLKNVKLPPHLKVVAKTAFQHCGFEEIDFSGDLALAKIEEEAFMNCQALKRVKLSPNLQAVAKTVFKNCHALESIDFGQNSVLRVLEEESLSRCSALRTVNFPQHLAVIGKKTFEYSGMRELDLTSATNLEMIGEESFLCCSSLYRVAFPLNLKLLAKRAFQRCPLLSEVDFCLATKLAGIGEGAFSHSASLHSVKLPPHLKTIENGAFEGCVKLVHIDFLESMHLQAISKNGFYRCESLVKVAFPPNLWVIGKKAFEDCVALESVDFSHTTVLQRIGDYSFANTALEKVTFPQSLNLISEGAFQRCEALEVTDFANAEALETIGSYAFSYCSSLNEVAFPLNLKVCAQKAYLQCTNLSSVRLGGPLEQIGSMAFYGCESLQEIDAMSTPDIGEDAFNFSGNFEYKETGICPNDLIHLHMDPEVESIDDSALQGRKRLRDIDFSAALRLYRIGMSSFNGCESLRTVGFPSPMKEIAECAFEGCIHLREIDFTQASSLEIIKEKAFCGCKSLQVVQFPSNVIVIGDGAFQTCSQLNQVDFGATRMLETIGSAAFLGCDSLSTVAVPGTVTFFGDNVFGDNPSLASIDIDGQNLALSIRIHLLYPTQSGGTVTDESLVRLYSINPIKERELQTNQETERSKLQETKSAYIESMISLNSEEFTVRKQHGWVQFLAHHLEEETDDFRRLIEYFRSADLETLRVLANAKDLDGRVALKFAKSSIRETFEEKLLFLGRYDLAQGPPIHKSSTCLVLRAEDYKMHEYYGSIFDKHATKSSLLKIDDFFKTIRDLMLVSREEMDGDGLRLAEKYFARADIDKNGTIVRNEFIAFCQEELGRNVALKFMRENNQFQRELEGRNDLDSKFVVNILRSHDRSEVPVDSISSFIGNYLVHDDALGGADVHDATDYRNVIVMPYGDRNLDTIFRSERPDTVTIRKLMKEVGEGLEHLHSKKLVHGDLKMSNIIRMNNRLCLIDLDSSARIDKDFVGAKFSSSVLPPELIYRLKSFAETKEFAKYFEKETPAAQQKRQPRFTKTRPLRGFVVKTFLQTEDTRREENPETGEIESIWNAEPIKEGLPYELVKAGPSLDVWSFGVLLYIMCAGQSLFSTDRDDDIVDANTFLFLHDWEETDLEKLVESNIRDILARDLLFKLLKKNPSERPTMKEVLMDEFFHPDRDRAPSAGGAEREGDEELRKQLIQVSEQMSSFQSSIGNIGGLVEDVRNIQDIQLDGLELGFSGLEEQGERFHAMIRAESESSRLEIGKIQDVLVKTGTMMTNISRVQREQVAEILKLRSTCMVDSKTAVREVPGTFEMGKSLKTLIADKSYPRCFILLSKDGLFDPVQYRKADGLLCCVCPLTMKIPRDKTGNIKAYSLHAKEEFVKDFAPLLLLSIAIIQAELANFTDMDFPLWKDLSLERGPGAEEAFANARRCLVESIEDKTPPESIISSNDEAAREGYRASIGKFYDSIGVYLRDPRFKQSGLKVAACMIDGSFELLHPDVVPLYQDYGRSCFGMKSEDIDEQITEHS